MTRPAHLRILACVAAMTLGAGAAAAQGTRATHAPRMPKEYTIEQFLDTVGMRGVSFSADESRVLFSSNKTGIWNAYSMPVTGGAWTPVTASTTDSTYSVSYFPHDDRILLTRDQGGNELNHLYVRAVDGTERDLTPGERLKAAFAGWTPDGAAFYVTSNERDQRFFDIYRYDARTYARALFYQNDQGFDPAAVSDDGRWVALSKPNTTNDSDMYLWNSATKALTLISKHEGQVNYSVAAFDPASKYLYYVTDAGSEFTTLRRYSLSDGRHEEVQKAAWDIGSASFSHNGRYRISLINEDGRVAASILDTTTGRPVALAGAPQGDIRTVVVANSEKKLAFYVNGDRSPNDLYVMDLGTGQVTRLTRSLNPAIDPADLVDAEVVRFKARDGLAIPNILWKPHQATPERKAPAIVYVHGGPGDQTMRTYNALVQYLANHGYVVLGINNRGSSGYGKAFFAADDRKHGHEPLWDCVDARAYLASLPYVDGTRVGIVGGSYGGYMVLAALSLQPDAFDVGVDLFGVSNWVRTLESIPAYWESGRKALYAEIGDPKTDRQMLTDISPLFHADRIRKPLMVLQGANDPRVIKAESDDIVAAVKKNGVPVEYIVFPDEGHGFTKKKNQVDGYGAMLRFLDQRLKRGGVTQTAGAPGSWVVPRTADGQPDLEGVWANNGVTPLERPPQWAGKTRLTDAELADLKANVAKVLDGGDAIFFDDLVNAALSGNKNFRSFDNQTGNYDQSWLVDRYFDHRTSLVIDPPDGRIPPLTREAQARAATRAQERRQHPADQASDLSLTTRCITFGLPNLYAGYNSNFQILQTRDYVVIRAEAIHDTRVIPLDGRAHVSAAIRQWNGDSRGHWEGDTLVVDTTNFSPETNFRGSSDHLHLIERFRRSDADTIEYTFTVDDPTTWTRPWTAMIPLRRSGGEIFEYACHEGNIGLAGILRGARVEEGATEDRSAR